MKHKFSVYVEKIEKRPNSGIWVTAVNGGLDGFSVTYNTDLYSCPKIGDRLVVNIESSENT